MKRLVLLTLFMLIMACTSTETIIKRDVNGKIIRRVQMCNEPISVFTEMDGTFRGRCGGNPGLESSVYPEYRLKAQEYLRERERDRERVNIGRAHAEYIRKNNKGKLICEGPYHKQGSTTIFFMADAKNIRICRFPQPGEREYFEIYKELHKDDPNHWLRYYDEE